MGRRARIEVPAGCGRHGVYFGNRSGRLFPRELERAFARDGLADPRVLLDAEHPPPAAVDRQEER